MALFMCPTRVIGLKALKRPVRHVRATGPGSGSFEPPDDSTVVNSITSVPFGNLNFLTLVTILICAPLLTTHASPGRKSVGI